MDLQQKSLKEAPFGVPEGYFESFPERLQERIRLQEQIRIEDRIRIEEQRGRGDQHTADSDTGHLVPFQRFRSPRNRIWLAAAVLVLALVSIPLVRWISPGPATSEADSGMAMLEQLQVFEDDRYLYDLMSAESETLDPEEAYENQVIEYLAIHDVEEVLLFN